MNTFKKVILQSIFLFLPSLLLATATTTPNLEKNSLAVFYKIKGDIQKPFNEIVEKELKSVGFNITDPHKRVNDQYKKKYGSTVLDVLSFMSVVNDEVVLNLLNIDPRIAGFSPFNMLIYKKLDNKFTHVGHLEPSAILDMLEITDATVREKFTASFNPLNEKLEAGFKSKKLEFTKSYLPYKKLPKTKMLNFEYTFERPDDLEDFIDEFQNKFELAFIDKKYLIAGYHNFMEGTEDAEEILKGYDAFWTYSLCHLEYSYNMFDNKDAHPEAGLFAPCSMYMYIKKDSNLLVIGMPTLQNWSDTLDITDKKRVGLVQQLDKEIPAILTSMGMKAVPNENPLMKDRSTAKAAIPAKKEVEKKVEKAVSEPASKVKNLLATFYTIEGDAQEAYNEIVDVEIKKIGFNVNNPHKRVNDEYKHKYGSTKLDVLSFMHAVNDRAFLPLLNIDPRIGGFTPFNMLIYKKLDDKNTHIGHIDPEAALDIVGIEDKALREKYIAVFKPLDESIEATLKAKGLKYTKSNLLYKELTKNRMFKFEYTFERTDDIDDFIDVFQNKFALAFMAKKYLIAGYHNFLDDLDDSEELLSNYDAFWSYSLCHLGYSYEMFDYDNGRPEAGLFAPCSMYMYIEKDSNKLIIGMPTLHNVSATLGLTEKKHLDWIDKLDREIPEILTSIGAKDLLNKSTAVKPAPAVKKAESKVTPPAEKETSKEVQKSEEPKEKKQIIENGSEIIEIIIPKPPKVTTDIPLAVQVKTVNGGHTNTRSIKFSKRIPPNYVDHSKDTPAEKAKNTSDHIGEVVSGRISAYIRAKYIDVKEAKATLEKAGFTILSVAAVNKKGNLTSIVFTNKDLTAMASKSNRGFSASLRLLVNKKDHHITITNPLYMAKGFMQDDFDEKIPKEALAKITSNFKRLLNSKDQLKFQLLPKYQFMHGMPLYQDMITVASGKNLLEKVQKHKRVVFIQKLDNGSILVGIKLRKRTNKFIDKIGTNNAALLPYPILIEEGKAKILDPKYYISVMYPLLQMSEFMTIATVPGAIVKDCERVFR